MQIGMNDHHELVHIKQARFNVMSNISVLNVHNLLLLKFPKMGDLFSLIIIVHNIYVESHKIMN